MTDATIHSPLAPPPSRGLSAEVWDTLVILAGSALMAAAGVTLACYLMLPFGAAAS